MNPTLSDATLDALLKLPFARPHEMLARHTTMRVGGPARIWVDANSESELEAFLTLNARLGVPLYVLGAGSNVVAAPDGFEGAVLHLGRGFDTRRVEGNHLIVGGAAYLPKLTHYALDNRLGNFEWACGIPGSVGGSVWGNAGARGWNGHAVETRDSAADFWSCVAFDRTGRRLELGRGDVEFAYRKSSLGELIVTEATFALKPIDEAQAKSHKDAVRALLERRRATQPANAASAGCIWKNPTAPGQPGAGTLVEQVGLKGHTLGGAQVSTIHGNFVINTGGADADEVRQLVALVEARVKAATGIRLEREARFL